MNHQDQRVVWMLDESIAHSHPKNWNRVWGLEVELVSLIGDDRFRHEIINPLDCLESVAKQIRDGHFSTVFDLTGWLSPALGELFPGTEIFSGFSMSRVRVVSSPRLETSGYVLSMSDSEIAEARKGLDLSHPLFVDDTSFSGKTSLKAMELWGVDPETATHAFLIANTGDFGAVERPGAVRALEQAGSRVVFGHSLHTIEEDGWHLKDLHSHPLLDRAFPLAVEIQQRVHDGGAQSDEVAALFADEKVRNILFPESFTSAQVRALVEGKRFVLADEGLLGEGMIHARNPFLWSSPYFQEHIDFPRIRENGMTVFAILQELHQLTNDHEGKLEASLELKREMQRILAKEGIEGSSRKEN
jgi:hypothetical protein